MGRQPCCDKVGLKKGPWTANEDKKLITFILTNGQCCWRAVPKLSGLLRCGKSCRLRWTNYLRPDLKRGLLSEYEEKMVIDLHAQLGNRWSKIASHLAGRTDNEIKNHWNTHIKKKLKKMGIDPATHKPLPPADQAKDDQGKKATLLDQSDQESPKTESPASNGSSINERDQENKEPDTSSMQSTVTEAKEEEDKGISQGPFESSMQVNNGFCIDEVPLIDPEEILVPNATCSSSLSSSSSSSSSSSCYEGSHNAFDQVFLPGFDWQLPSSACEEDYLNNMDFWDDDFISSLDMFINYNSNCNTVSVVGVEPPPAQYPEMVSDEDSWKFERL